MIMEENIESELSDYVSDNLQKGYLKGEIQLKANADVNTEHIKLDMWASEGWRYKNV